MKFFIRNYSRHLTQLFNAIIRILIHFVCDAKFPETFFFFFCKLKPEAVFFLQRSLQKKLHNACYVMFLESRYLHFTHESLKNAFYCLNILILNQFKKSPIFVSLIYFLYSKIKYNRKIKHVLTYGQKIPVMKS